MTSGPIRAPEPAEARALVAAADEGSLARAGAALGVSQPAMTKRIRALEALAGVALLERDRRGVRLTDAGRRLLPDARRLVAEADRFACATAELRGEVPPMRIAVIYAVAESVLPSWLAHLRERAGAAPVEVRVGTPDQVRGWVAAGESDLGISAGLQARPGLVEAVVGEDELVAVVPPGHPWARAGRVAAAELSGTPLILRERGSGTRELLQRALAAAGLPPAEAAVTLASTSAVRAAVLVGGTPGVLSRLVLGGAPVPGDVVPVPVDGVDLRRPIVAVRRRGTRLSRAQRAFLAVTGAEPPGW